MIVLKVLAGIITLAVVVCILMGTVYGLGHVLQKAFNYIMIQYHKRKILKYDSYEDYDTGVVYTRGDVGFNERDLQKAYRFDRYRYNYDKDSNFPIGFLTILIVPLVGFVGYGIGHIIISLISEGHVPNCN